MNYLITFYGVGLGLHFLILYLCFDYVAYDKEAETEEFKSDFYWAFVLAVVWFVMIFRTASLIKHTIQASKNRKATQ